MSEKQESKVVPGGDNVFEDLGFDAEEAVNLKIRADLMLDLKKYIRDRSWTHEQAANFFGETVARTASLVQGQVADFSIDKLVSMLSKAGMRVRVEVLSTAA